MKIGLIGAGRLGICLALLIEQAGHDVIVSDIREKYVEDLQKKRIGGFSVPGKKSGPKLCRGASSCHSRAKLPAHLLLEELFLHLKGKIFLATHLLFGNLE